MTLKQALEWRRMAASGEKGAWLPKEEATFDGNPSPRLVVLICIFAVLYVVCFLTL